MAEYIERKNAYRVIAEKMLKKTRTYPKWRQRLIAPVLDLINVIGDIPAADVRENVRGKWIIHYEQKNIYGGVSIECAVCHTKYVVMRVADENFCRNCGAYMRGDDNV